MKTEATILALGLIRKWKPKFDDTFGRYRNWYQNQISKVKSCNKYWNYLALVWGIFSHHKRASKTKRIGFDKVWTFWEGHKIWKNLPLKIWRYLVMSNFKWNILSNIVFFSECPNFTNTEIGPWFWFPITKPGFGRTL